MCSGVRGNVEVGAGVGEGLFFFSIRHGGE